jgi:hypothetical protein
MTHHNHLLPIPAVVSILTDRHHGVENNSRCLEISPSCARRTADFHPEPTSGAANPPGRFRQVTPGRICPRPVGPDGPPGNQSVPLHRLLYRWLLCREAHAAGTRRVVAAVFARPSGIGQKIRRLCIVIARKTGCPTSACAATIRMVWASIGARELSETTSPSLRINLSRRSTGFAGHKYGDLTIELQSELGPRLFIMPLGQAPELARKCGDEFHAEAVRCFGVELCR